MPVLSRAVVRPPHATRLPATGDLVSAIHSTSSSERPMHYYSTPCSSDTPVFTPPESPLVHTYLSPTPTRDQSNLRSYSGSSRPGVLALRPDDLFPPDLLVRSSRQALAPRRQASMARTHTNLVIVLFRVLNNERPASVPANTDPNRVESSPIKATHEGGVSCSFTVICDQTAHSLAALPPRCLRNPFSASGRAATPHHTSDAGSWTSTPCPYSCSEPQRRPRFGSATARGVVADVGASWRARSLSSSCPQSSKQCELQLGD
ncbi:hypothetical protein B0H10DRAFT_2057570 [Mycena sp. CBHHK59/15]|nr:hypothetical protein B0H10DRAFT_2057570 [Mycena sp. CBHHK59/15]